MFTSKKRLVLAICLALSAFISIKAQQSKSAEEWFINLPSSPLSVRLVPKPKAVRFDSHSTGDIVRFRVGCVAHEKDSFTVREALEERRHKIDAGLYYGQGTADPWVTFFSASDFEDDKNHCEQMKAKVGVIEVEFSDGAIWKARY